MYRQRLYRNKYCTLQKNTDVELFDISDIALETAEKNIKRNNVSDRVKSYKMDILNEYPKKSMMLSYQIRRI